MALKNLRAFSSRLTFLFKILPISWSLYERWNDLVYCWIVGANWGVCGGFFLGQSLVLWLCILNSALVIAHDSLFREYSIDNLVRYGFLFVTIILEVGTKYT